MILNLGIWELKYENFYPASSQPVLYVQGGVKKQLGNRQYANDFVNTKRYARRKPSALRVNDFWKGLKVSCEIKIVHFMLNKIRAYYHKFRTGNEHVAERHFHCIYKTKTLDQELPSSKSSDHNYSSRDCKTAGVTAEKDWK